MSAAASFLDAVSKYGRRPERPNVRLATVATTDTGIGGVRVIFDGETVVSGKPYPYVGTRPRKTERVVMLRQGRGYFVLGSISPTARRPAGVIEAFGGSVAPAGALICDGAAVSRTTYADLYAAIGTTYGAGDGSTTFNVPPGGRVLVGRDAAVPSFDTLGETGGAVTHSHALSGSNAWALLDLAGGETSKLFMKRTIGAAGLPSWTADGNIAGTVSGTAGGNDPTEGVDLAGATNTSESMQPYVVVNFVIWT